MWLKKEDNSTLDQTQEIWTKYSQPFKDIRRIALVAVEAKKMMQVQNNKKTTQSKTRVQQYK